MEVAGAALSPKRRRLFYQAPYNWDAFFGFIGPRAIRGVEHVDGRLYCRAEISVSVCPDRQCVVASGASTAAVQRFFDLRAKSADIDRHLAKSRLLARIVKRQPGVRVPGCWDPFELAVRAMLGQQVTVKGATTLIGRLVERFGPPKAETLSEANLTVIGIPRARAESITGFARAVVDGRIPLNSTVKSEEMIGRMCELPGIGPWTANYIAMRALRDPDAFPASDLGLLKASGITTPRRLSDAAEAWRPWRAYAVMHLWESLRRKEKDRAA